MALSKQTLDHLLEVESHLRSAIKCAAVNENPLVVNNLGKILLQLDSLKRYEKIIDMLDNRKDGSSGSYDIFFNE